jgi:peroxiredoxin
MILDGALIYYLIYSGDTETDMTTLETIALSFQRAEINSIDSTVTPEMNTLDGPTLRTSDTYFQMALGAGWIVSQASTAPSEAFLVLPDTSLLPFVFGGQFADTLPGLFIQVVVQPYDLLFGSADTQITADDRAFVMDQAIGSLGGVPDGAVIESTAENLTRLEVRVNNAFGGDNRGYILIIDANQTMYSVSFVGAAANWEEDYQPLVTALIDSIQIATAPPTAANPNSLVVGIQRGQLAPDFTVTLVDGSTLSLSDLRGQIVLLNFWATWCVPCRAEMPEFQQAFEANQDQGFTVLAVNLLETPTQIQAFADELGLSFPLALDPNGEINSLYRVAGYPSTYIIDRQGVILAVNIGPVTATQVQEWVRLAQE